MSFTRNVDKGLYEIPAERLADALRIKGIRRTRWSNDLMRPIRSREGDLRDAA